MDGWKEILTAMGASSIITTVVTAWLNRKITKANANNKQADYAEKIIEQSEARVLQVLADYKRAIEERDKAYKDASEERQKKHEWRERCLAEQKAHHQTQLALKDVEMKITELEWHKCERNGCFDRTPPRKIDKSIKIEQR